MNMGFIPKKIEVNEAAHAQIDVFDVDSKKCVASIRFDGDRGIFGFLVQRFKNLPDVYIEIGNVQKGERE